MKNGTVVLFGLMYNTSFGTFGGIKTEAEE